MKIALTGATGFVGRYLTAELLAAGHEVRAWHRPGTSPPSLATSGLGTNAAALADRQSTIEWLPGRLGDGEASEGLVEGTDAVVHAGLFRGGSDFMQVEADPVEYFEINVIGSLRLLEAAARSGRSRFVFISSGAVHQRVVEDRPLDERHPLWPETLYGSYKASVETLIHTYGWSGTLNSCSLRPTAIYGVDDPPRSSKWFDLIRAVAAGRRVEPRGGSKEVHVGDVAKAARLLVETDEPIAGETFNCSDRMISRYEVAETARRISGSEAEIVGEPKSARHPMDTSKLERLGMRFAGTERLEETVAELLRSGS